MQKQIDDLTARVDVLQEQITGMDIVGPLAPVRCSAQFPHTNMFYNEGVYRCPCGQAYLKADGALIEIGEEL